MSYWTFFRTEKNKPGYTLYDNENQREVGTAATRELAEQICERNSDEFVARVIFTARIDKDNLHNSVFRGVWMNLARRVLREMNS